MFTMRMRLISLLNMQGSVMGGPYSYDSLTGWGTAVCFGKAQTEGAAGDCFTALP